MQTEKIFLKKIKYRNKIWEYDIENQDYCNKNDKDDILFSYLFNCLMTLDFINDEVEIIEEETKKRYSHTPNIYIIYIASKL